jgi:hypothetical protein
MHPHKKEGKCLVPSGGAVIGSSFYRKVFLNKNKRLVRQPLPTKIILRRQYMKTIIWKK